MHRGYGKGFPGGPGFEGRMLERGFDPHWIDPLVMLGLITILLIAAYFIFKRYRLHNNIALQILNKRFVTGEIGEEEYLRKKELLLGKKIKKNRYAVKEIYGTKEDYNVSSQTTSNIESEQIDNDENTN